MGALDKLREFLTGPTIPASEDSRAPLINQVASVRDPLQAPEIMGAMRLVKEGPALDYLRQRLAAGVDKVTYPVKTGGERYTLDFYPHSLEGTHVIRDYPNVTASTMGDAQRQVGEAQFVRRGGDIVGHQVNVEPAHQRRGLATAMYDLVEYLTGQRVRPDSVQTDAGAAFTESRSP